MKKLFAEVAQLGSLHQKIKENSKNPQTIGSHLQKLSEEFGELAQSVNKITGLKSFKKTDTLKKVKLNIKEETADCIQILFLISHLAGFNYKEVKTELGLKNEEYRKYLRKLAVKKQTKSKAVKKIKN